MRLLTWNINGVRTLPHYHPWNTFKTHDDILNNLEADIICFQEMKSSRPTLSKSVALPPSYHSFFSFPARKSGYSGVATYARIDTVSPLKAEEGLTGLVQPKPPFKPEERISRESVYPSEGDKHGEETDYRELDSEGRAVVVDFGMFVLINVYCPNDGVGTEERDRFKMAYHKLLESRVRGLVEQEGREVIVVGDLNACAAVIDHCEGPIIVSRGQAQGMQGDDPFYEAEYRRWIRDWLVSPEGAGGYMLDVTRHFWPERKGMYTCWNTKISARESNYGTRIDYILVTKGLLPWVKFSDTQPHIKGSDHCPVFVDFHDEIVTETGETLQLSDFIFKASNGEREPPRLAAKFWEEHSGKQISLDEFFGKKTSQSCLLDVDQATDKPIMDVETKELHPTTILQTTPDICDPQLLPSPPVGSQLSKVNSKSEIISQSQSVKRKLTIDSLSSISIAKKQKQKNTAAKSGQAKLSNYFGKPSATREAGLSHPSTSSSNSTNPNDGTPKTLVSNEGLDITNGDDDSDLQLAILLSQESAPSSSQSRFPSTGNIKPEGSKQAWSTLLAPIQPPLCRVHQAPTRELTVNKPGPNKGKRFFICSRPVGPGYDKGKAERLREEVDPQWRCDFFKWSSDVRKEMGRKGDTG